MSYTQVKQLKGNSVINCCLITLLTCLHGFHPKYVFPCRDYIRITIYIIGPSVLQMTWCYLACGLQSNLLPREGNSLTLFSVRTCMFDWWLAEVVRGYSLWKPYIPTLLEICHLAKEIIAQLILVLKWTTQKPHWIYCQDTSPTTFHGAIIIVL